MPDGNAPWWIVAGSAIPSIAVGCWTLIQWWGGREERQRDREIGASDKREQSLAREREMFSAQNLATLQQLREDFNRCRELLETTSGDRYRGWDLARKWHDRAWDMRHQAIHARQYAESLARLTNQPPPTWPGDVELPPFDPSSKTD